MKFKLRVRWDSRSKLIASLSALVLLIIASGAFTVLSSHRMQRHAESMSRAALVTVEMAGQLRVSLANLKRLYAEGPAARDEAEEWAGLFRGRLQEMPGKCTPCHMRLLEASDTPDVDALSRDLGEDFETFHSAGIALVQSRSERGLSSGGFSASETLDRDSEAIGGKLDELTRVGESHLAWSAGENRRLSRGATRSALLSILAAAAFGGAMALGVIFKMKRLSKNVLEAAQSITQGNLEEKDLESDPDDEAGRLLHALGDMKTSLRGMIVRMSSMADRIASSAEELSATVTNITERMRDQTSRAEQAASATTEMSQTVLDIASNASAMASSSEETLKIARDGADIVGSTADKVSEISDTVSASAGLMQSLGARSRQIGDIVGVINDIADQTNLLALNAAIEAARAGEQGRGFAVVADEVRKLAERTARATAEIGQMIGAIQNETEQAVSSMGESLKRVELGASLSARAGESLRKIVESAGSLQGMVDHIASATEEMSTTSDAISSDIEAMATESKQTSTAIAEITRASATLAELSSELRQLSGRFKTGGG